MKSIRIEPENTIGMRGKGDDQLREVISFCMLPAKFGIDDQGGIKRMQVEGMSCSGQPQGRGPRSFRTEPPDGVPDFEYIALQGDWEPAVGHRVCVRSIEYDEKPWFGKVVAINWLAKGRRLYEIERESGSAGGNGFWTRRRWCALAELERPLGEIFAAGARDDDGHVCTE